VEVVAARELPLAISARQITPIVFWASFVPWASATIDDEPTCAHRNSRSARCSTKRLMIRYTQGDDNVRVTRRTLDTLSGSAPGSDTGSSQLTAGI
jgi:hypothetical protein